MLTAKQEAFAQYVASGMKQIDAYREAFNRQNWNPNSLYCESSKLAAKPKIAQRIKDLKEQLAEKELWKREDSVRVLRDVISDPEARCNDKTQAVKVLNDMHGFNAPQEINHNLAGLDDLLAAVLENTNAA